MEIIIVLISTLCIILGWAVHRKTERIKIIESQLSDKKYKAYADMVGVFYTVLKNIKKDRPTNPKDMMDKMIESKRDILMYGSDQVLKAFNKWLCATGTEENTAHMKFLLEFILSIRKDMCGKSTQITEYDILVNLTQNEADARAFLSSHL